VEPRAPSIGEISDRRQTIVITVDPPRSHRERGTELKQCRVCRELPQSTVMLTHFLRSLTEVVPPPDTRKPLTTETFLLHLLPVIVTFYATSLLVVLPGTSLLRLALLPCTLWSAFRASTTIDLVKAYNEPRLTYWNQGFCVSQTPPTGTNSDLTPRFHQDCHDISMHACY
jgi:hypothetical protein